MKHILILSALTFSVISAQAMAQDAPPPPVDASSAHEAAPSPEIGQDAKSHKMHDKMAKHLEKADPNNDGNITHEEFLSQAEEHFKEMDGNKDGKITKEERQKFHETQKEKRMERKAKLKDKAAEKSSEAPKL